MEMMGLCSNPSKGVRLNSFKGFRLSSHFLDCSFALGHLHSPLRGNAMLECLSQERGT